MANNTGGEDQFDNSDDSAFKNHVLYVVPGDPNCARLEALLLQHPIGDDVWTQNAMDIPRHQRPSWLTGVPILVVKAKKQAHKGDNIYRYLREWKDEDYNLQPAGSFSDVTGFDYQNFDGGDNVTDGFAGVNQLGTYTLEDEQRPPQSTLNSTGTVERTERSRQAEKESQERAKVLMEQRGQMDVALQSRNRQMRRSSAN